MFARQTVHTEKRMTLGLLLCFQRRKISDSERRVLAMKPLHSAASRQRADDK